MESFWGSVNLMLFIYALAAVISLIMAWIIKYIFVGIRMQNNRADARKAAKAATPPTPSDARPQRTA
jgi:hypothetical protein